jgi:hypothetical protein
VFWQVAGDRGGLVKASVCVCRVGSGGEVVDGAPNRSYLRALPVAVSVMGTWPVLKELSVTKATRCPHFLFHNDGNDMVSKTMIRKSNCEVLQAHLSQASYVRSGDISNDAAGRF